MSQHVSSAQNHEVSGTSLFTSGLSNRTFFFVASVSVDTVERRLPHTPLTTVTWGGPTWRRRVQPSVSSATRNSLATRNWENTAARRQVYATPSFQLDDVSVWTEESQSPETLNIRVICWSYWLAARVCVGLFWFTWHYCAILMISWKFLNFISWNNFWSYSIQFRPTLCTGHFAELVCIFCRSWLIASWCSWNKEVRVKRMMWRKFRMPPKTFHRAKSRNNQHTTRRRFLCTCENLAADYYMYDEMTNLFCERTIPQTLEPRFYQLFSVLHPIHR